MPDHWLFSRHDVIIDVTWLSAPPEISLANQTPKALVVSLSVKKRTIGIPFRENVWYAYAV